MKFRLGARAGSMSATALSVALAATAFAGPRYSDPGVTVIRNADGSGRAFGTLGGTRNSSNNVEKLACTAARSSATNSFGNEVKVTTVVCSAVNKNSVAATCVSTNESFADALSGVANDGLIEFSFNASGTCTQLTVYESSSLERKR